MKRQIGTCGLFLCLPLACTGGHTSIGSHEFETAALQSGEDAGPPPCTWSADNELVAEWHANGNLENAVPCSPFQASIAGMVPYGPGQTDLAWQFRSTWSSVDGGDPNFIDIQSDGDVTLDQITLDAWVQQTHFNDYGNSNRIVVSTSYRPLDTMLPGEAQIYLHENKSYLAFVKTGVGNVLDEDWAGCHFASLGGPEELAPLDTWFRLTVTYDGATLRCYVDTVLQTETSLPMKETAQPALMPLIGRNFPGDIDAVRVFRRALSDTEVATDWP